MKRILGHFLVSMIILILINTTYYSVYAIDPDIRDGTARGSSSSNSSSGSSSSSSSSTGGGTTGNSSDVTESNWVKKAFSAAHSFLTENIELDSSTASAPEKMVVGFLTLFKNIVKAVNKILLVALFAISALSISVIGVRYITSRNNPNTIERAKRDLHTTFIGMGYGFGAFIIWNIAMSIVTIIIKSLAG